MDATAIVNRIGQTLDLGEAARAARRIRAVNKACWWNAARALREVYRRTPDARYVEGWGLHLVATAHAWLEIGGQIVDPTPAWQDADAPPLYFPAVRFTRAELRGLRVGDFPRHRLYGPPSAPHIHAMIDCHAELFKQSRATVRRFLNVPAEFDHD